MSSKVTVFFIVFSAILVVVNGFLLYKMGAPRTTTFIETNLEAQIRVIERSNVEIDRKIVRFEKEITNAKIVIDRASNVDDAIRGYFEILSNQAGIGK